MISSIDSLGFRDVIRAREAFGTVKSRCLLTRIWDAFVESKRATKHLGNGIGRIVMFERMYLDELGTNLGRSSYPIDSGPELHYDSF